MPITPDAAAQVLAAGGDLKVQVMPKDSLVHLATLARQHNVRLEIKGALPAQDMVEIVRAGAGHASFDVS